MSDIETGPAGTIDESPFDPTDGSERGTGTRVPPAHPRLPVIGRMRPEDPGWPLAEAMLVRQRAASRGRRRSP